ncbi:MAG: hypothetical protein AAAFM81_09340 [Pseudomonadota bacterium]
MTSSSSNSAALTVLRASGVDHKTFLQGQLTQDIQLLSEDRPAMLAASCDAKGRVLAVLTVVHDPEGTLIVIRSDIADDWIETVLRYRLRAKVDIDTVQDRAIHRNDLDTPGLFELTQQAGTPAPLRWRVGDSVEHIAKAIGDPFEYSTARRHRLLAGIAEPGPLTVGKFTPHMLGLQHQNAISFNKGCYTGQEIVARTEHLGAAKRGPIIIASNDGSTLIEGTNVLADDKKLGVIASAEDSLAIAVVNLGVDDALSTADGRALRRV